MDEFVKSGSPLAGTRNIFEVIGARVLSPSGKEIGKIREVRLSHRGSFEGIVVGGTFSHKLYIAKEFIKSLEKEAALLSINPAAMYVGFNVLTSDGKRFGKVVRVVRQGTTNTIKEFVVRRLVRTVKIPKGEVKDIRASVMLEKNYADAKRRFTRSH